MTALVAIGASSPASAQAAEMHEFDIPAQNAADALRAFGRQSGVTILFDQGALSRHQAAGLKGRFGVEQALRRLLAPTGLTWRRVNARTFVVTSSTFTRIGKAPVEKASLPSPMPEEREALPAPPPPDIVVTGTRIVRTGYHAPTPVTALPVEQIEQTTPTNIPDALNKMPQFVNSRSQERGNNTNAQAPFGGNYLDLRGIGAVRGLILLDGRRVPPTSFEGTVDANTLPQMLIRRVDIVTGGVSAIYGADAVSGVVNFVLDREFQGVKAVMQSGISEYGDDGKRRAGGALGTPIAGGRGHLLLSAEVFRSDGIAHKYDRPLFDAHYLYLGAGTAADPRRIYANATFNAIARGGYVVNGPFAGLQFAPGGTLAPFDPGQRFGFISAGGDGANGTGLTSLTGELTTYQAFGRLSYNLSGDVEAFVQASYGRSINDYAAVENEFRTGIPIFSGNAYLPADAQALLTATNTAGFLLNRGHDRLDPATTVHTTSRSSNVVTGLEGRFGRNASWTISYTHGDSRLDTGHVQSDNARFYAAIDAVDEGQFRTGIRNGNVVCRVTLIDPAVYPGCVPMNLFGEGSISAAARAYVNGVSRYGVANSLDEVSGNVQGEPFALWAGPVSLSLGASYRRQSLNETSNADPSVPRDFTGLRGVPPGATKFIYTNVGTARGAYDVKEIYAEGVVPLARDLLFAKALEINGAIRFTDYSTSGGEVTWKAGLSYTPVRGLRFRGTISRDIRAPTLFDLFAGRFGNFTVLNDTHSGRNDVLLTIGGGNPDLKPEVGRTRTFGVVVEPAFLPDFTISADYYDLKITGAISPVSITTIVDRCEASNGEDRLCARIDRPFPFSDRSPANFPSTIDLSPINLASLSTRGIDIEASYSFPLKTVDGGTVTLRGIMTYLDRYVENTGLGSVAVNQAGRGSLPRYRASAIAQYSGRRFDLVFQGKYSSSALVDTVGTIIYVPDRQPASFILDMTLSAKIKVGRGILTPFLTINNLFDREAPLVPGFGNPIAYPTNTNLYDVIGRRYTAGLRARF